MSSSDDENIAFNAATCLGHLCVYTEEAKCLLLQAIKDDSYGKKADVSCVFCYIHHLFIYIGRAVCPSVCPATHPPIFFSVYQTGYLPFCVSICLLICLCLSIFYLSVYLSLAILILCCVIYCFCCSNASLGVKCFDKTDQL